MSLPDISELLPECVDTPEAMRIMRFLQFHDRKLSNSTKLTLYGSAAVSLYLADSDNYNYGYTNDIDIGRMEPESVELSVDEDAVDPPLKFQPFGLENWLVHPDWELATVDFSPILNLHYLRVELLHPIDLVITKLGRGSSQDIEDSLLLRRRYISGTTAHVADRTRCAWNYRPVSKRERRTVEDAFESVFEEPLELE